MSTAVTNLLDPPRPDVGRSPERPRVLIAEDDRDLRELLEEVFRDDGWIVHSAPNGTKLLDELSQAILDSNQLVPDLVLTDIMMPGVQVMSVLGELRAAGWTTPVIVVSARADEIAHEIGRALDPIVFCQKPVALDRLLRIAHAERRQRTPQPPIYRGAHPSSLVEERPKPEQQTRIARPPDRPMRTLKTLLRRRPIVHVAAPDGSALRKAIEPLETAWDVRVHSDGTSFLEALGRDLLRGDPPDVVLFDPSTRRARRGRHVARARALGLPGADRDPRRQRRDNDEPPRVRRASVRRSARRGTRRDALRSDRRRADAAPSRPLIRARLAARYIGTAAFFCTASSSTRWSFSRSSGFSRNAVTPRSFAFARVSASA